MNIKNTFLIFFALFICSPVLCQLQYSTEWQKCYGGNNLDFANAIRQTFDGGYIVAGASLSSNGNISGHIGDVDGWVVKLNRSGSIEWERSVGSLYSDVISSIQQTRDSGYIIAGSSSFRTGSISGNTDFYIVKLNAAGEILWQKYYGGSAMDRAFSIQQTMEGGYIVAGETFSNNGDVTGHHGATDMWILKLDISGNLTWQKSLGGTGYDRALSIRQTKDTGYIVVGSSSSTNGDVIGGWPNTIPWIVKLSPSGVITWQKEYGGKINTGGYQEFTSVIQTNDGGYISVGGCLGDSTDLTDTHGGGDFWVVKTDANGNLVWRKALGGSLPDYASDVQQTMDGGYIVVGQTNSHDGDVHDNNDFTGSTFWWIVKLSSTGAIEWKKSSGSYKGYGSANAVQQTSDGGMIIAGVGGTECFDFSKNGDYGIMKLVVAESSTTSLNLYPNPTFGLLNIELFSDRNMNAKMLIFDISGRKVNQENIYLQNGFNTFKINTSKFAAGSYVLYVSGTKEYSAKFIKISGNP